MLSDGKIVGGSADGEDRDEAVPGERGNEALYTSNSSAEQGTDDEV